MLVEVAVNKKAVMKLAVEMKAALSKEEMENPVAVVVAMPVVVVVVAMIVAVVAVVVMLAAQELKLAEVVNRVDLLQVVMLEEPLQCLHTLL